MGEADEEDILAMTTLRRIAAKGQQVVLLKENDSQENTENRINDSEARAIFKWCSKSYWNRVWSKKLI